MYNAASLKSSLINLVGFRQNRNYNSTQLKSLLNPESGLFVQNVHPLLTLDNLETAGPDFSTWAYQTWEAGTSYNEGDLVTYDSLDYVALRETIGDQPDISGDDWLQRSKFENWLIEQMEGAIIETINDFLVRRANLDGARTLLESERVVKADGRESDLIVSRDKLTGHELRSLRSDGIRSKINKVSLRMTEAQSVTIYLFHSRETDAIKSTVLEYTDAGSEQWFDISALNWEIKGAGTYYLGYDMGGISGSAINGIYEANSFTNDFYFVWRGCNYTRVVPFEVEKGSPVSDMFAIEDVVRTSDVDYGLNLEISTYCDYTDFLINNKKMFAPLIWKKAGIKLLRGMALNPNNKTSGGQTNLNRGQVLYEIDGDSSSQKPGGLAYEYEQMLKGLSFDRQQIDSICLDCAEPGIEIETV